MTLQQIVGRIANYLQDIEHRRWGKMELMDYVDDAQAEFVRLTSYPMRYVTFPLSLKQEMISVPDVIAEVKKVRLNDFEMRLITSSELDSVYRHHNFNSSIRPWRTLTGTPIFLVMDTRSARSLSVVPTPTEPIHLQQQTLNSAQQKNQLEVPALLLFAVDADGNEQGMVQATSDELQVEDYWWEIEGVMNPRGSFLDANGDYDLSSNPVIAPMYMEALVYGGLDRAYQKENELRNLEKAKLWSQKFYQIVGDCNRSEGRNALSGMDGTNRPFLSLPFPRRRGSYRNAGPVWNPQTLVLNDNSTTS